ncbi:hypothetical protein SVAN01_01695 [Stagonosporopsis vannaccii]|nr:hypothetical protein SVAN01_01695 [Stagonosporopsis vannaccii]
MQCRLQPRELASGRAGFLSLLFRDSCNPVPLAHFLSEPDVPLPPLKPDWSYTSIAHTTTRLCALSCATWALQVSWAPWTRQPFEETPGFCPACSLEANMSGPFRFNQQSAQSPLERVASPFSAGAQPVSYKTNVNRAKTKKWVEAKKNAYDGDDWGDYDEYDEYGVDTTPPPEPAPPSNQRYYGQRPPYDTPSRSFTDPAQQLPLPKARRNSFDAGEEQRSFSASVPQPQPQHPGYAPQSQHAQPSPLQTSSMGYDSIESQPQSRDVGSPNMPQPLQTRVSPGPANVYGSPVNTQFPPRKSSIGQGSAPPGPIDFIPIASSPRERSGSQDKPLPFIRPADIYKRVEEERRRESIESQSRPSLDSLSSRPKDEPTSPNADRRNLQPLETVAERKSEYLPDLNVTAQHQDNKPAPRHAQHEQAPSALEGIPTFDNEFWSSGPDLQSPPSHASVVSPSQDQGLRSVVDQAFTRSDDQRSVPPTPISKDSDSDLNRSNTGSTSGISPIMSRVPSSATAALKNRGLGDGSTPVIAEEPHEAGTPVSGPTSSNLVQNPHPFQGHARNVSNTSLPRSGLATPTRGDSPARSPAFGPQKTLPEPETAQFATDSSDSPDAMAGDPEGQQPAYATREADIAEAMLNSPVHTAPELGAAHRQSQDAFLESHKVQSPISDALPRDRSESPSKGRVQALAGKFGEVSSSRRGSTQSNVSRNSVQSWERSRENSRAPSPSKGSPKKEFRPHLPGGWESYAITTPAPLDRRESEKGLAVEGAQGPSAPVQLGTTEQERGRTAEKNEEPSPPAAVNPTPPSEEHAAKESEQPVVDPVSALKTAGAAMTASLRTSIGLGESAEAGQEQRRQSYGDVYKPRPLHMDRSESAASSVPPTPPAKDTPRSEFPPTPPLKQASPERLLTPERPGMTTQLSTDPSADDQESDRLRKEIVASLSPLRMSTVPSNEPDHYSLRPDSKGADRASSILDSYYAELEKDSPRTSNDINRDIPELAPLKSASSARSLTSQNPSALHRFSWEANSPHLLTPEKQPQAAAIPEPIKSVESETVPAPTIEKVVEDERQRRNDGVPEDPYFGSGHTFTVTKPEPLTDASVAARTPTPPLDNGASLTSPPTREQTRSPGLHIVNSAQDPEAVDLPPRWSAEHSAQPSKEAERESPAPQELKAQQPTNPAISADAALTGSIETPASSAVHDPEPTSPTSPRSPTSGKPLGAREIATIGSTAERIATYNKTREQWANTDHGLSSWIAATFEADPSLATPTAQAPSQLRPQSGVFRHKHTGSLAMLGKFTGSSNNQPSSGTYEQYSAAGAQVPTSSQSPTSGPSKTSSGFLGRTGSHSIQTQQMQAKGKDLLHTAGVLSGKGMTSAKGLFAKGKSRFNRDKDSAQSGEALNELEQVSAANTTTEPRSCTTTDSPEVKRRRRFSSPFRRSRSRPRSASAALPSTPSLQSSTSLTAVSTDVPDIPKAFQGRPHSYPAPDLSMHPAYRGSTDQLSSTPPSYEQARMWVQPLPTRSSFVTETEVQDESVPPVPPIPAGINSERRGRRSRSWGNASLMLQSAIQHAALPTKGSRSVGASPIVAYFDTRVETRAPKPHTEVLDASPLVACGVEKEGKNKSSQARHSSPITKGLWMGDTSPVLSKRTPTKVMEVGSDERQPELPRNVHGTLAPADVVQLSKHYDENVDNYSQDPSKRPPTPSSTDAVEDLHDPWAGTFISNNNGVEGNVDRWGGRDEAPLPRAFVMQLPSESPLLHSAKASLHKVSDDEDESSLSRNQSTQDQTKQRRSLETGIIGAGDVSEEEEDALGVDQQFKSRLSRSNQDEEVKQRTDAAGAVYHVIIAHENGVLPKTSNRESTSSHTVTEKRQDNQTSYETTIIGVGDVSPTSDHEDTSTVERASARALDMQSALESKVIGAGDVSPVSTRSFDPVASSSEGHQHKLHGNGLVHQVARPVVERFYTADSSSDIELVQDETLQPESSNATEERPRIERFETAHEGVQGSSELTISRIGQPASRFATVMSSEPIVSYKEYPGSSSNSSDNLLEKPKASSLAVPRRADASPMPTIEKRRSASQLQVVHAVEEYAASNSSLESWDQDSNAADAISEPGATVAMKDESDLVTPVAHVPSNPQHGQQADQAANSSNTSSYAASNGYFAEQSTVPAVQAGQQGPVPVSNMTVPERSKSLLSIISSAVSSVPISPASSNAGRSTPSTIHRMQRDFSNARKTNLTDVKIPEEPGSAKDDSTPTARNEDYDLYADHNGVVKDVRDDKGQPLRIASTPSAAPVELARTITGGSSIGTAPDVHDSPGRRYSFERPMSFISGPQDDDGRPQDQINQPVAGMMAAAPPRSKRRSQQYPRAPSGAVYSNFEPVQDTHWPPGEVARQSPAYPAQPSSHESGPPKVARQPTRFVPHAQKAEAEDEDNESPVQQNSTTSTQRTSPSIPTEIPVAKGQLPLNGHQPDQTQDPRVVRSIEPQPRSVSAPLHQMLAPSHDHRVVSQPLGSPPAGSPAGPRNEFEYQQQMMQLQAKYPRLRGAESQAHTQQSISVQQSSHTQEKPPSKPRLAAALKGIVGRTSPNALPVANAPPLSSSLAPTAPTSDANRAESFVSAVSSLSREPNTSSPGVQAGAAVGPQRPPSFGADSQYSHISHGSTQVQPAQSRQDLTLPATPAQYQNQHLKPQQPQQGGQPQNHRASTGAIPEGGKKKRFSAIAGLFGKNNPAAELQGKFKLSREEKKAQKAQRHTSQPTLQSQPTQQWPPPNTQFIAPQQPNSAPVQGPRPGQTIRPTDARFLPTQGAPGVHSQQGFPNQFPQQQTQPQVQQVQTPQQNSLSGEGSAYLRTKQMAEDYRARQSGGQPPRPVYEDPASVGAGPLFSGEQAHQPIRHSVQKPLPSNGYYYPEKPSPELGAYASSHEEQQRALYLRQQQQIETERRLNAGLPRSPGEQDAFLASVTSRQQAQQHQRLPSEPGAYGASQIARQQALHQQQAQSSGQQAYGATPEDRQRLQQDQFPLPRPEAFGRSQIHYDQIQHHGTPQRTSVPPQEHQQLPQNPHQPAEAREDHRRHAEEELARQRWQQQQMQLQQFHMQQQAQNVQQQAQIAQQQAANRSVSGHLLSQASPPASPVVQRHVSSPEPQYDTPPIPEAYGHVQGVFVSPRDRPHAYTTPQPQPQTQPGRHASDAQMQPISPQISAQSQMPPNTRHHSDASSVSVISPISGPHPEPSETGPAVDQRLQKPRMPSISEVHQQAPHQERPWHMNFPAGTTEQDIVRARQKQFLQQQFASQQQAQAERHAASPSPRGSPDKQSPPFSAPLQQPQEQGGGFREVLPRTSPQSVTAPYSAPLNRRSPQPTHSNVQGNAGWPLHAVSGHGSPVHHVTGPQASAQEPRTPVHAGATDHRPSQVHETQHTPYDDRRYEPTPPNDTQSVPPVLGQPQYDDNPSDDAPPSYDGPGVPHEGMEKSNPDRPRPPNIITTTNDRGRQQDGRPRQASLGLMQHPQPASMAASPQRTAPDMGAESLRRQMLQQEEHARMERIQRSQMQAAQRQREQQEREAARARAQELERGVSGGGRVGSLRSVSGSRNGGTPGWERRGLQGSNNRPIFELPALEDEEPVMRATSFPGQEWVPPIRLQTHAISPLTTSPRQDIFYRHLNIEATKQQTAQWEPAINLRGLNSHDQDNEGDQTELVQMQTFSAFDPGASRTLLLSSLVPVFFCSRSTADLQRSIFLFFMQAQEPSKDFRVTTHVLTYSNGCGTGPGGKSTLSTLQKVLFSV